MIGQSWRVLVDDWLVSAELAVAFQLGRRHRQAAKNEKCPFCPRSEGCATKKEVTHMITYVVDIRGRNVRGSDEFSEAMWLPLCSPSLLALPHTSKASSFSCPPLHSPLPIPYT
jgi:hypothetical protein